MGEVINLDEQRERIAYARLHAKVEEDRKRVIREEAIRKARKADTEDGTRDGV